jgi:hypothetical protein
MIIAQRVLDFSPASQDQNATPIGWRDNAIRTPKMPLP